MNINVNITRVRYNGNEQYNCIIQHKVLTVLSPQVYQENFLHYKQHFLSIDIKQLSGKTVLLNECFVGKVNFLYMDIITY